MKGSCMSIQWQSCRMASTGVWIWYGAFAEERCGGCKKGDGRRCRTSAESCRPAVRQLHSLGGPPEARRQAAAADGLNPGSVGVHTGRDGPAGPFLQCQPGKKPGTWCRSVCRIPTFPNTCFTAQGRTSHTKAKSIPFLSVNCSAKIIQFHPTARPIDIDGQPNQHGGKVLSFEFARFVATMNFNPRGNRADGAIPIAIHARAGRMAWRLSQERIADTRWILLSVQVPPQQQQQQQLRQEQARSKQVEGSARGFIDRSLIGGNPGGKLGGTASASTGSLRSGYQDIGLGDTGRLEDEALWPEVHSESDQDALADTLRVPGRGGLPQSSSTARKHSAGSSLPTPPLATPSTAGRRGSPGRVPQKAASGNLTKAQATNADSGAALQPLDLSPPRRQVSIAPPARSPDVCIPD